MKKNAKPISQQLREAEVGDIVVTECGKRLPVIFSHDGCVECSAGLSRPLMYYNAIKRPNGDEINNDTGPAIRVIRARKAKKKRKDGDVELLRYLAGRGRPRLAHIADRLERLINR